MTMKMKEIIEKMVKQEIKDILAEHKSSIREMVKTSLLPDLKAVVRDSICTALEDLTQRTNEIAGYRPPTESDTPQVYDKTRNPELGNSQSATLQADKSEIRNPLHCRRTSPKSEIGLYLYCIADGDREASLGNMGIESNEVYTIPFGDLSAIVHNCTAEPYHSDDHDKVKDWVLTHQKVVDAAWEKFGTVIPIGFDTIIQGKEDGDPKKNMKKWIEDDYDNLTSKLAKIQGKAEYGVQIFWETKIMAYKISDDSLEIRQLQEEIRTKPKGIAYMYRQKLEELLKNELANKADQHFQEFYEEIRAYADDLRVEKTKKTEDEGQQMLLNLSCLLPKDQNEKLGEALERIDGREGFSVRYTGPWPPYSFV